MKNIKNFLIILIVAFIAVTYNSCDKDQMRDSNKSLKSLTLDIDSYNSLKGNLATDFTSSELIYSKSNGKFISHTDLQSKNNSNDTESLIISSSLINLNNLNDVFSVEDLSVIAITLFKEDSSDFIEGIAVHLLDSNNEVKLYIYNNTNNNVYEKIDLDAKEVDNFKYDHIFYISKKFFPGKDIESLVINTINDFTTEDEIDDFSILEIVSRLGADSTPKNYTLTHVDDEYGNGKPCGLVPLCWNGGNNTYCAPFAQGCRVRGGCGITSVEGAFTQLNMTSEKAQFSSTLPNNILYSLKDELESFLVGNFLIESYYSISKYFEETLDAELLYTILTS